MCPDYLLYREYREEATKADDRGIHPDLLVFVKRYRARLRKMGVPIYAASYASPTADQVAAWVRWETDYIHGWSVDIKHSTLRGTISEKGQELLGHIGQEVAGQSGIKLQWRIRLRWPREGSGVPERWCCWELAE